MMDINGVVVGLAYLTVRSFHGICKPFLCSQNTQTRHRGSCHVAVVIFLNAIVSPGPLKRSSRPRQRWRKGEGRTGWDGEEEEGVSRGSNSMRKGGIQGVRASKKEIGGGRRYCHPFVTSVAVVTRFAIRKPGVDTRRVVFFS
jgi:hypothetical protein